MVPDYLRTTMTYWPYQSRLRYLRRHSRSRNIARRTLRPFLLQTLRLAVGPSLYQRRNALPLALLQAGPSRGQRPPDAHHRIAFIVPGKGAGVRDTLAEPRLLPKRDVFKVLGIVFGWRKADPLLRVFHLRLRLVQEA